MTVSDYCSRRLFRMPVSDDYSGLLFRMTILDAYFRWLFQMTVPNDYFRCLRMAVPDYCSRWIFWMFVSDDFSGWLFVIPRLILISATNSYFQFRFLFQPIIRLIGPTTDSFLNDGFLLQNYGPDPLDIKLYSKRTIVQKQPSAGILQNMCS